MEDIKDILIGLVTYTGVFVTTLLFTSLPLGVQVIAAFFAAFLAVGLYRNHGTND